MNTIGALIIAWILSLFGLSDIVSKGINELFDKQTTSATYYLIFFIVGLLCDVISEFRCK